jgi:hypothetical protein
MQVKHYLQARLLGPANSTVQILKARAVVWVAGSASKHNPIPKWNSHSIKTHAFNTFEVIFAYEIFPVLIECLLQCALSPKGIRKIPFAHEHFPILAAMSVKKFVCSAWLQQQPTSKADTSPWWSEHLNATLC